MFSGRMRLGIVLALCAAFVAPILTHQVLAGIANIPAGVEVSPDGVFRTKMFADPAGVLLKRRLESARATLPTPSECRRRSSGT